MEDDSRQFRCHPVINEKKCNGPDDELIEFLRSRHMALHGQTNHTTLPAILEYNQTQKPKSLQKCGDTIVNSSNFMDETQTASWFHYPLDNSIEKEFSEFFSGMPTVETMSTDKAMKEASNVCAKLSSFHTHRNVTLPSQILSSVCGSNQVNFSHTLGSMKGVKDSAPSSTLNRLPAKTYEPAITTSVGSRRRTTNHSLKRKTRDAEESEGHSEEAEHEPAEANKPDQRPASGRRSRSAQIHNLSERRRRDKINEKMRALQELIPHCNKSDKASMLDEAIEYLKSLQLQLQIMWMGNGMAPMLFPSIQQYMSGMDIGTNQNSTTSTSNLVQLPRTQSDVQPTMPGQPHVCHLQGPDSISFATHIHDFHFPEQYSSYLSFPQMQMPPQVMNMCTYGPQMMKQNQMVAAVDKQQQINNKSSI